jgi:hypothetical protein
MDYGTDSSHAAHLYAAMKRRRMKDTIAAAVLAGGSVCGFVALAWLILAAIF